MIHQLNSYAQFNKKSVSILVIVFLLAITPSVTAQQYLGVSISICSYDGCSYDVSTGLYNVSVTRFAEYPVLYFSPTHYENLSYTVAFSAVFEAIDTNQDDTFNYNHDYFVGSILPLNIGTWNHSQLPQEVQDDVYESVNLKFTADMSISHQDPQMISTVNGWSNAAGHTNIMDIDVGIDARFDIMTPNQFKLALQLSGWQWTYQTSILVFVFRISNTVYLDGEYEHPEFNLKHQNNRISFGQAWMEYAQNAYTNNTADPIQVHASNSDRNPLDYGDQNDKLVFIAFEYFGNVSIDYETSIGLHTSKIIGIESNSTLSHEDDAFLSPTIIGFGIILFVIVISEKKIRKIGS